jgi:hypothetical protein
VRLPRGREDSRAVATQYPRSAHTHGGTCTGTRLQPSAPALLQPRIPRAGAAVAFPRSALRGRLCARCIDASVDHKRGQIWSGGQGGASLESAASHQVAKAEHCWSQQRLMGSAAITLVVPLEVSGPDKSNCTTQSAPVGLHESLTADPAELNGLWRRRKGFLHRPHRVPTP